MSYNAPWNGYQQYPNFRDPCTMLPMYGQYAQRPAAQQPLGLNGMMVQSVDSITADAVPMDGSAAFFPKQDLSEIYVKSWNPDGTIKTLTFRPVENPTSSINSVEEQINTLIVKVNTLETSLNKIQNGKRNYNRKDNNQT